MSMVFLKYTPARSLYLSLLLVAAGALFPVFPSLGGSMAWNTLHEGTQAYARTLTPQQVAQIRQVGSAVISEDGRYAAYTRVIPADPLEVNERADLQLYIRDLRDGSEYRADVEARAGNLQVRPAQGTFSFTARRDGDNAVSLYEIDPARRNIDKLFEYESNILSYSWHPTGLRFSFIALEELDLPENPLPYEPTVYEENIPHRQVWIAELQRRRTPVTRIQTEGTHYLMSWSPCGEYLAVSETPTPHIDDFYMFQRVKIIHGSSGQVRNEIDNAGKLGQITWSPDSRYLALRAGHDLHDPIDGRIMVVPSSGGTPENIYPGFPGKFEQIEWVEQDKLRIIISESTTRSYGTIRPDGSGLRRILGPEGPVYTSFSVSLGGDVLFVANTAGHPSEIYRYRSGAREAERLTDSNPWLEAIAMGRQEVVNYYARDGRHIEGLLIYPVDERGNGPWPTIVMVHGGPEAHYSNGWLTAYSMPGQLAAGRGFAVFYPNYRGSTGRGIEFITSSQADLSGAEFDDIVDGVDELIRRGIADADRVGVTGGSYGGYATAWMSTRYSKRFAAGVMFVGISNNISKWGTSDIPEELYLVHSRARLWDNWMGKLRASPIYHVSNAQTPLLIMHGEQDTRVHPAQSLELYRHLKVRRPEVPVRLIWYPGEGHGNINATSRFDYNLRMMRWFETYLLEDDPQKPDFHLDFDALGVQWP